MKNLKLNICLIIGLIVSSFACTARKEGEKETIFKVYGNCSMCKKTIEKSLAKDAGVLSAEWNKDTKMMTVTYDTSKTNIKTIHKEIASSGYDTELERGSDEAYNSLHECCQYKRK